MPVGQPARRRSARLLALREAAVVVEVGVARVQHDGGRKVLDRRRIAAQAVARDPGDPAARASPPPLHAA
jgi:hypothetical protein